ncbi:MAG: lysine--tRNA ligase, partial [Nitrococcus sp.]|nr:lysine--tRNA ligase [Nitrococcus sp.]
MSNRNRADSAQQDQNKLIAQRREKLAQWRASGGAFPNDFRRDSLAAELHRQFGDRTARELEQAGAAVKVAGRIVGKRVMGKASFAHIQDMSGRIQ